MDWRRQTEKDLDEVLQAKNIFTNVSKGDAASTKDMLSVFGTDDLREVALIILEKGDLQVVHLHASATSVM